MPVFLAEQSKDYQGLEVNRDDLHRMAVCGPSPDAPHESLPVVAGGMAPEEAARLQAKWAAEAEASKKFA